MKIIYNMTIQRMVRKMMLPIVWLWQLPQVFIGCVWCIISAPRFLYAHQGVMLFTCRYCTGVSFGPMAFYDERHRAALLSRDPRVMPHLNHEYGHSVSSRRWGPLYLLVIGIPSVIHLLIRRWLKDRIPSLENYYAFYSERWANINGGVEAVKTARGYTLRLTYKAPEL